MDDITQMPADYQQHFTPEEREKYDCENPANTEAHMKGAMGVHMLGGKKGGCNQIFRAEGFSRRFTKCVLRNVLPPDVVQATKSCLANDAQPCDPLAVNQIRVAMAGHLRSTKDRSEFSECVVTGGGMLECGMDVFPTQKEKLDTCISLYGKTSHLCEGLQTEMFYNAGSAMSSVTLSRGLLTLLPEEILQAKFNAGKNWQSPMGGRGGAGVPGTGAPHGPGGVPQPLPGVTGYPTRPGGGPPSEDVVQWQPPSKRRE